jgi:hypothetical protein
MHDVVDRVSGARIAICETGPAMGSDVIGAREDGAMPPERPRVNWLVRTSGTARDPVTGESLRTADILEFSVPVDGEMVRDETDGPAVLTGWRFPGPREAIEALDGAGFSFVAHVRYVSAGTLERGDRAQRPDLRSIPTSRRQRE